MNNVAENVIQNEFGACTYIDCKNPAVYNWFSEDKNIFKTCKDHSILICELYKKRGEGETFEEIRENREKYKAAIILAKMGSQGSP